MKRKAAEALKLKAEEEKRIAEEKRKIAEEEKRRAEEAAKEVEYRFTVRINDLGEEEAKAVAELLAGEGDGFRFRERDRVVTDQGGWISDKRYALTGELTIVAPRNRGPDARKVLIAFLGERYRGETPVDWRDPRHISTTQDFSTFSRHR